MLFMFIGLSCVFAETKWNVYKYKIDHHESIWNIITKSRMIRLKMKKWIIPNITYVNFIVRIMKFSSGYQVVYNYS